MRIRAPREMAVCQAFGQGGDARWPFARQRAGEMAVCQAPGQRDGRLPGKGPPPTRLWPSSGNLAKVGWAAAYIDTQSNSVVQFMHDFATKRNPYWQP